MIRASNAILFAVLFVGGQVNAAIEESLVRVAFVKGDAKIFSTNGIGRVVKKGDIIKPGEKLVTGSDCIVQAFLGTKAIFAVRPDTQIIFERVDLTKSVIRIVRGNIRVHNGLEQAHKSQTIIDVETPNGRIAVKNADNETTFVPDKSVAQGSAQEGGTYTRFTTGSGALVTQSSSLELSTNQIAKLGSTSNARPILVDSISSGIFTVSTLSTAVNRHEISPISSDIAPQTKPSVQQDSIIGPTSSPVNLAQQTLTKLQNSGSVKTTQPPSQQASQAAMNVGGTTIDITAYALQLSNGRGAAATNGTVIGTNSGSTPLTTTPTQLFGSSTSFGSTFAVLNSTTLPNSPLTLGPSTRTTGFVLPLTK